MKFGIYNLTLNKWLKEDDYKTDAVCNSFQTAKRCLDAINEIKYFSEDSETKKMQFEIREYI